MQHAMHRVSPGHAVQACLVTMVCLWALLATGCMRGRARMVPEVPLAMPAPPPRVVEVVEPEDALIIPLPEEPVPNTPPRPRLTPTPRPDPRVEPRVDAEVTKPAEEPVRPSPAPTLQTAPAQQEGEAERRVRLLLAQATSDLNRINVQGLNTDARQQFDTARRFVAQAEDALKNRNLVFARNLADKAAALASQLSGR